MSSETYFNLRRDLLNSSRKLSHALRTCNQKLIDILTARVKMLIAQLSRMMSQTELKRIMASAGLVIALNVTGSELSAQSFGPPVTNPFGLGEIRQGAWIHFADLDGDGDNDALAGGGSEYQYGLILYYENIGNAAQAAFIPPVENPFGIDVAGDDFAMPAAVDIDDDGDLDLMISTYSGLLYLENSGSATQPAFNEPVSNPFGIMPVEYMFSPTFADLDNDGDLDLLIGSSYYDEYTYEAQIFYYENTGDASNPEFGDPVANPFGIAEPGYYFAFPALADLDNDGDLDLLVGGTYDYYSGSYDSNLKYFENTGDANTPEFADGVENPFGLEPGYYFAYPAFADMDDDGDMDLFVGEVSPDNYEFGQFIYFENLGTSSVTPIAESDLIDIYPNPATRQVNIRTNLNIRSIELVDALGRQMSCDIDRQIIDISSLPPGAATLRIVTDEGIVYTKNLMVIGR